LAQQLNWHEREKKTRVDDAFLSRQTRASRLKEVVVAGGGVALVRGVD